ncbi:MAG: hypothetical protein SGARI_005013 [Bacillariaceae sp.]
MASSIVCPIFFSIFLIVSLGSSHKLRSDLFARRYVSAGDGGYNRRRANGHKECVLSLQRRLVILHDVVFFGSAATISLLMNDGSVIDVVTSPSVVDGPVRIRIDKAHGAVKVSVQVDAVPQRPIAQQGHDVFGGGVVVAAVIILTATAATTAQHPRAAITKAHSHVMDGI